MVNQWPTYVLLTALVASALGIFIWKKKSKKFVKVGIVAKLVYFPVKSLKGIEVSRGRCTKIGFEVDGILDRSFMLVDENGILISQRQHPLLVKLTPAIQDNYLFINCPGVGSLKIKIKQNVSPVDKIIKCKVHTDYIDGVDCGEEAASWFSSFLNKNGVRLVQYLPNITTRTAGSNGFFGNIVKNHPVGFQDLAALHILSEASVKDLNLKIDGKKVSENNFRPNILIKNCKPYAEDSWKYIKINEEAEILNLTLTTRCLLTTNDPDTGVLSQKEPLVTLRKYRIVSDDKLRKQIGSIPCLGIGCAVLNPGEINVGDEVFAVVKELPKMQEKL